MITQREERVLRSWLEDEPPILPTHVWYAVMGEIPATRQRRSGPLERIRAARPALRLLAAAVLLLLVIAALVAGVGATRLLGPAPPPPRPFPPGEVPLEPGPYVVDNPFRVHAAFDVPEGWVSAELGADYAALARDRAIGPTIVLTFAEGVYRDACNPDLGLQEGQLPSVSGVAGVLADIRSVSVTTPAETTIGGRLGRTLSIQAPTGAAVCTTNPDEAPYALWGLPVSYGLRPGDRADVWVVYAEDPGVESPLVVVVEVPPAAEPADVAAARGIVASLRFGAEAPVAPPSPRTPSSLEPQREGSLIVPGVPLTGGPALMTVKLYDPEASDGTRAGAAYDLVVGAPAGWVGTTRGIAATDGTASIEAWSIDDFHPDPCHWQTSTLEVAAYGPDGIAAVVASDWSTAPGSGGPVASGMTDPPWNGHRAWLVDLQVPEGIDPATCDGGTLLAWEDPIKSAKTLVPGAQVRLQVIDLDGAPLVVAQTSLPGMTLATRDAAEAAANSLWIGRPINQQPLPAP